MRYLLRAASFALLPLAAACTNQPERPAVHPAPGVPVRDFPEIAFLEGRWLRQEGGQRFFLLFEPDGRGGLKICEGGTAVGYAQPSRSFIVERGRMMVRHPPPWDPHLPNAGPLLWIGPGHVAAEGLYPIRWRRLGDRLEVTPSELLLTGEDRPLPTQVYRLIRGPEAEVDVPNCHFPP